MYTEHYTKKRIATLGITPYKMAVIKNIDSQYTDYLYRLHGRLLAQVRYIYQPKNPLKFYKIAIIKTHHTYQGLDGMWHLDHCSQLTKKRINQILRAHVFNARIYQNNWRILFYMPELNKHIESTGMIKLYEDIDGSIWYDNEGIKFNVYDY